MAKLVDPPARFTTEEWMLANHARNKNAERERSLAQRLIAESTRLANETEAACVRTQSDVKKKLQQRLDDIRFWKKELDDKLDALRKENEMLDAYRVRVEKALEAAAESLTIATNCLANRDRRRGIELTHDDTQKELMKEIEVEQGVVELLKRTHEEMVEQIRLNRRALFTLEKDLADKFKGLSIDEYCEALTNSSPQISFKSRDVIKVQPNSVSPEEWQDFSHKNIEAAEQQRSNSINLRSMVDTSLATSCNDMTVQVERTNEALAKRVRELKESKTRLEGQLAETLRQFIEQEENIKNLRKAIEDKVIPMKLAQTRLDSRAQRPNVELTRDAVQFRLLKEVDELDDQLQRLRRRLAESESSLKGLRRQQLAVEEDIENESNTIYIDEVQCMGMRKSISLQQF